MADPNHVITSVRMTTEEWRKLRTLAEMKAERGGNRRDSAGAVIRELVAREATRLRVKA